MIFDIYQNYQIENPEIADTYFPNQMELIDQKIKGKFLCSGNK